MKSLVALMIATGLLAGCSDRKPLDPIAPDGPTASAAVGAAPSTGAPLVDATNEATQQIQQMSDKQAEMLLAANAPVRNVDGASQGGLNITVHKSATCGCCEAWIKHLESNGFTVAVDNNSDMNAVKDRLGVPGNKRSCHTGEINGMFVEGHVPAEDIKRMVKMNQEGKGPKGITVPGMPIGSPGMEMGAQRDKYDVFAISKDGQESILATHN